MKSVEQLPFPELLDITEGREFLCTSIRHMRRLVGRGQAVGREDRRQAPL